MNKSLQDALQQLPHGPEFRFVDELTRLVPGVEGEGIYRVRGDEVFLKGHFPGYPLFPGVLLLEAAAQLAGTVAQSDPAVAPLKNLRLTAIHGAKILGSAVPGEVLTLKATVTGRMGGLVQAEGNVSANGKLILRVGITLSGEV